MKIIPWLALMCCCLLSACAAVAPKSGSDNARAADGVTTVATTERSKCVELPPQHLDEPEITAADTALLTAPVPEEAVVETDKPQPVARPLFDFPVEENEQVRAMIRRYTGSGRQTFARWLRRSGRYLPMMREIFAREGLPRDLAALAMVESGFNSNAHSWANAVGHWQFIESTGRMFGLKNDWWRDERRDVEKSTIAAARYLKYLYGQFDGNWYLAVAAYNAGPGKIARAVKKYHSTDFWQLSKGRYLRAETRDYIPKLLAALIVSKQPEKYGFCNLEYEPPLQYETVTVPQTTDLDVLARLTGSSYAELKTLNAELKRWCTPPGVKDYRLKVPVGHAEGFAQKYAAVPADQRARYRLYRIKAGDNLGSIARRYHVRVRDIVALNKIGNPRALRIGKKLILPLQPGYSTQVVAELKDDYQRSHRRTYTVRSGDSLWTIARKCGVSTRDLRRWNRLGWSNVIKPGQVLAVSAAGRSKAPRRVARNNTVRRKMVYSVRRGDTLWAIGRKFAVNTRDIRHWNGLDADHVLHPGDKLTLLVRSNSRS